MVSADSTTGKEKLCFEHPVQRLTNIWIRPLVRKVARDVAHDRLPLPLSHTLDRYLEVLLELVLTPFCCRHSSP